MFYRFGAPLVAAAALLAAPLCAQESGDARPRIALSPRQMEALRGVDAPLARAFEPIKTLAERALNEEPQPIIRIVSEGRLYSDPARQQTIKSLRDIFKIEALGYAYAASGKREFGEKARSFILAWARRYDPDGNPINETEFPRLMKGYDLARDLFSASERMETDRWLLRMAETEKAAVRPSSTTARNNWHSHRLKIIGHAAFLLPHADLIRWLVADYKRHLDVNLYPDGETFDFRQRDALHYHVYDLLPLVELALAADKNGENFYGYTTPAGASLEKSIAFLIPYIVGEKTHREFVHSTVPFDRERSVAGDPSIQVGSNWNPAKAKTLFDLAGYFQPRFHEVKFPGGDGARSFDRLLASYR